VVRFVEISDIRGADRKCSLSSSPTINIEHYGDNRIFGIGRADRKLHLDRKSKVLRLCFWLVKLKIKLSGEKRD